jgi:molybdopterin molybdotransferase
MLTSYVGANCYIVVKEGVRNLRRGEFVEVVLF